MGNVIKGSYPPPDETLTQNGVAADAAVVGNKIAGVTEQISAIGRQVGGLCSNVLGMSGVDFTFKITANEDTTVQNYRVYFLIYVVDQGGGLFASTLVWRGPSGDISTGTIHGSGSLTHSNGTITGKSNVGSWGNVFVFWSNTNITIS